MAAPKSKLNKKDFKDVSLTPRQKEYSKTIYDNTITFCWGPAGSSKTFSACYTALNLLMKGEVKSIIITKPIQESGEKLGSLPGAEDEKVRPYLESFLITMEKIISKEKLNALFADGQIQFKPLAYMRGATFDDAIMILDEAQNCDMKQLMLYVSRIGHNAKTIVAGDITQHDIAFDKVALPTFVKMVEGIDSIGIFEFNEDDIVRSEILKEIVRRYEEWKYKVNVNGKKH